MSETIFDQKTPSIYKLLIFTSLLFVPGVYLILLLAAYLPLYFWWELAGYLNKISTNTQSDGTLLNLISFGAIIASFACLRGIWITFFHEPEFELAIQIDLDHEQDLDAFIGEICANFQINYPDLVILHSEPTFFVKKGKLKTALGGIVGGNILAIGLPLLYGLSKSELRAILVHEFSHFTGQDTLYSSIVLPVYLGTQESLKRIRSELNFESNNIQRIISGLFIKLPMVIPYSILYLYINLFKIIDMIISRAREKRADIISAQYCGSQIFSQALNKVVVLSQHFYFHSKENIINLLKDDKAYVNYYSVYKRSVENLEGGMMQYPFENKNESSSIFDSHPTLRKRIQYLPNVPNKFTDTESSITLFHDIESHEKILTDYYTEYMSILYSQMIKNIK